MAKRKRNPSSDAGREGPRRVPGPPGGAEAQAQAEAEADDTATPPIFPSTVLSDTLPRPLLPESAAGGEDGHGRRLSYQRPPSAGPKVPSPQDVTMTSPAPSSGPAAPTTTFSAAITPNLLAFGAVPPPDFRRFAAPGSFINTSSSSSSSSAAFLRRPPRRNPTTDSENFSLRASPSIAYRSAYVEDCDDSESESESDDGNDTPSTIYRSTSIPPTPASFLTAADAVAHRMARMPAEYRPAPVPAIDYPDVTRRRTRAQIHAIPEAAREQRVRGHSPGATARQGVLARTVSGSSEFEAACSADVAAYAPGGGDGAAAAASDEVKSPLSDTVSTTKTSLSDSLGELNISADEETAAEERAQLPKGTKRTRSHSSSSSGGQAALDDSIISTTTSGSTRRPMKPPPAKAARLDPVEIQREALAAASGGFKERMASGCAPATPSTSASGESSEGPPTKRKRKNPDAMGFDIRADKGKGKGRGNDKSSKSASTTSQPKAKTKRSKDSDVKTEQKKKKTPTTARLGSKRKRSASSSSSSSSAPDTFNADLDVKILPLAEDPEPITDPTPQDQSQLPRIGALIEPLLPDPDIAEQRERALLVWQDDEITGREQDPEDSADDGFGLDGVGFEPPPARKAELKRKMNESIAGYTRREQSSQRALRRQRRAGTSTAQGSSDGSKESEGNGGRTEDGSGSDSSRRRKRVRFNPMD